MMYISARTKSKREEKTMDKEIIEMLDKLRQTAYEEGRKDAAELNETAYNNGVSDTLLVYRFFEYAEDLKDVFPDAVEEDGHLTMDSYRIATHKTIPEMAFDIKKYYAQKNVSPLRDVLEQIQTDYCKEDILKELVNVGIIDKYIKATVEGEGR